jgi:hypothetical protein
MNELVRVEDGVMVAVAADGALVTRPDASLAPAGPRSTRSVVGSHRLVVAVAAAAVVAVVAVGAASFAGGTGSVTPSPAGPGAARGSLAAAASGSAAAGSVALTVSAVETSPGSTTSVVSGTGDVDLATGTGTLTATVPALASALGAAADSSITVVSDGGSVYLEAPALASLAGGKPWFKLSASSAASMVGGSAADSLSALSDPRQLLALLGALGSPVTDLGTVQLDGSPATEYTTTVTAAGLASHAGSGAASAGDGDAAKALQQLGIPSVPVSVWVGQDGMVRQVTLDVDLSHATLGGVLGGSTSTAAGSSLALTLGLTHYGQPVSVAVPPASQVTDLDGTRSSLRADLGSITGLAGQVGSALSGLTSRA